MAFADPQTITISATPYACARTGSGINQGSFADPTRALQLTVAHTYGRRIRRVIKFVWSKIAADTYNPTMNSQSSLSMALTFDLPTTGFTLAEQQAVVAGVMTWLAASTNAKITQLLSGES